MLQLKSLLYMFKESSSQKEQKKIIGRYAWFLFPFFSTYSTLAFSYLNVFFYKQIAFWGQIIYEKYTSMNWNKSKSSEFIMILTTL